MRTLLASLILSILTVPAQTDEIYLVSPCRWVDTRVDDCVVGSTCEEGPMVDGDTRFYLTQAVAVCPAGSAERPISFGAKGLIISVTTTNATGSGYLVLFMSRLFDPPPVTTHSFGTTIYASTTTAVVELSQEGPPPDILTHDVALFARVSGGGSVDVIMDIVGYVK